MSKTLSERMIEYRAVNRLSQTALAQKCGVTLQTINSVENGIQKPSKLTKAKIELVIGREDATEQPKQPKLAIKGDEVIINTTSVSISKIKAYKACKRLYWLRYIQHLKPIQKSEALQTGSNYHKLLEILNKTGELPECDFSKEYAMATAYKKYIYPHFKVVEAEKWLTSDDMNLVGIVDGIADDGHIVEHKSTSMEITEQYEYNLMWDEQILAYMFLTGSRKVWYTVCRKPTIRQKKSESDEEFYDRMVQWYDTDTESKIRLLEISRTDKEVEEFKDSLNRIICDMERCKEPMDFYRNTCHCNAWGKRCEYSSICLDNVTNQSEYIEFTRD